MRRYQVQLRSLVGLWLVALMQIVGRTNQVFPHLRARTRQCITRRVDPEWLRPDQYFP
jgi:hypothetical protein